MTPTVMSLLIAHPAICLECLARRASMRSDVVFRELDRLGVVPAEGHCATCVEDAPVYSIR